MVDLDTIPALPDYRAIELSVREIVQRALALHPPETSEISFTNLFAWNATHPIFLSRVDQTLLLWRGPKEKGVLLPPIGLLNRDGVEQALSWAEGMGGPVEFGRVGLSAKEMLLSAMPELKAVEDRDNADYVYKRQDLAELAGRHYDGKRNQVKKFHKRAAAEYRAIDEASIEVIADAQAFWCDVRECSIHADLEAENKAVTVILEHWRDLKVFGGALWVDGRVAAFSVAETLAPGTAVVHVEKGDTTYPGVYQAINQAFCRESLGGYEFVNREQDLGVEGLRKAKENYHPDHLVMKFSIRR